MELCEEPKLFQVAHEGLRVVVVIGSEVDGVLELSVCNKWL